MPNFDASYLMAEEQNIIRKSQQASRLSTVVSISLVLFLLGSLGILLLHAQKLGSYVKESIQISVILKPESDSASVAGLIERVQKAQYVRSVTYVSKESAAESLKSELGEDFISFLGYNPLTSSLDIRLKGEFSDMKTMESLATSVKSHPMVSEVHYPPSLMESVHRNMRTITWILLSFSALLFLVSVALINNTIRISLYARRLLIKSMLLVGATKGFIRGPFLLLSIWNGLLGALISVLLLAGLSYIALVKIPELSLIRDLRLMGIVAVGLLITGILLSLFCTWFALNRYLRYRTIDLN